MCGRLRSPALAGQAVGAPQSPARRALTVPPAPGAPRDHPPPDGHGGRHGWVDMGGSTPCRRPGPAKACSRPTDRLPPWPLPASVAIAGIGPIAHAGASGRRRGQARGRRPPPRLRVPVQPQLMSDAVDRSLSCGKARCPVARIASDHQLKGLRACLIATRERWRANESRSLRLAQGASRRISWATSFLSELQDLPCPRTPELPPQSPLPHDPSPQRHQPLKARPPAGQQPQPSATVSAGPSNTNSRASPNG